MKTDKAKTIMYFVISGIVVVSAVVGALSYFAKSEDVEKKHETIQTTLESVTERFDIGASDDQIFQQQQTVRRWEAESKFEKRQEPPTDTERQVIEQEKLRLAELERKRNEKIMRYEKSK